MRMARVRITISLICALLLPGYSQAETVNFKEIQAKVTAYKNWLDQVGTNGSKYWIRLDSSKRPHRLFVGEGFLRADFTEKERFIEIFSRYLAGHPEKNMLIDIFDGSTEKAIGEYGFGGFKLF